MRCRHLHKNGNQCKEETIEGSSFCHKHASPKANLHSYILSHLPLKESSARHAASEIASLRDEIAITRALVEERLNLISNPSELLAACGQVNSLLLTIERLVQTSVKTEEKLGELLSKTAVVELATDMVVILTEELKNIEGFEAIIDSIGLKFQQLIMDKTNRGK